MAKKNDPVEDHYNRQRTLNTLREKAATASLVPSGPEGRKADQRGAYATDDGDYHQTIDKITKDWMSKGRTDMGPGHNQFDKQDEENEPFKKWRK